MPDSQVRIIGEPSWELVSMYFDPYSFCNCNNSGINDSNNSNAYNLLAVYYMLGNVKCTLDAISLLSLKWVKMDRRFYPNFSGEKTEAQRV